MKSLAGNTKDNTPKGTAWQLLENVPLVMRAIRSEIRSHRAQDLSVPQFRSLMFVYRHPGVSLTALADHLGLTLPTVSKMIETLVQRKLVRRTAHGSDRRRCMLDLSHEGHEAIETARTVTQEKLSVYLKRLTALERRTVNEALLLLRRAFTGETEAEPERGGDA